jgi:hypothetical protein
MPPHTLGYWVATGLFCALFTFGGASHLVRAEGVAEGMQRLGYPAYVMTLLGVAKLLGVAALLAPGRPLLKEWAYAGFGFDLLGAAASHAFAGDWPAALLRPLPVLALGAASYLLRPEGRRLREAPTLPRQPRP